MAKENLTIRKLKTLKVRLNKIRVRADKRNCIKYHNRKKNIVKFSNWFVFRLREVNRYYECLCDLVLYIERTVDKEDQDVLNSLLAVSKKINRIKELDEEVDVLVNKLIQKKRIRLQAGKNVKQYEALEKYLND